MHKINSFKTNKMGIISTISNAINKKGTMKIIINNIINKRRTMIINFNNNNN